MNDDGKVVTTGVRCEPDIFPEKSAKIIRLFGTDFSSINF
jgi:hypothetical protein